MIHVSLMELGEDQEQMVCGLILNFDETGRIIGEHDFLHELDGRVDCPGCRLPQPGTCDREVMNTYDELVRCGKRAVLTGLPTFVKTCCEDCYQEMLRNAQVRVLDTRQALARSERELATVIALGETYRVEEP